MVILPYDFRIDMAIERGISGVVINRLMIGKGMSYDECLEKSMSPVQKDVFIIVDEWWKKYGCSPTLRQIADVRGKTGIGNTKDIVDRLVKLGVVKRVAGRRSIRPVYINFRDIE
jgi:hypothetical protein